MIDVDTHILPRGKLDIDMVSAYLFAVERLGEREVFLLESSGGPKVDCRESILGIGLLTNIEVFSDKILISAPPALQKELEDSINRRIGGNFIHKGIGEVRDPDTVWSILRAVNEIFNVPNCENAREFNFGFLACFSYDVASLIEVLPRKIGGGEFPLISLGLFQSFIITSSSGEVRTSVSRSRVFPEPKIDIETALLSRSSSADCTTRPADHAIKLSLSKEEYVCRAKAALDHIRVGDIYQVQIGHEITVESSVRPVSLYRRLRELNPSPYMFLCKIADHQLIGASPENYVRLEDRKICMRPIAGTIGKGDPAKHQEAVDGLTSSPKECAEHIMLVDLCRNDIARVAKTNSLNVESLMMVEEFSHLFHLVSTVSGDLAQEFDVVDLIKATFPAGTMTGAPKVRAMEIIEDLEVSRRTAYAGAVGLLGPGNYANLALCIRMAIYKDKTYSLRASAGIVSDSVPEHEWNETIVKMGAVYKALTGRDLVA